MPLTNLLFDLDGTLTDPKLGISRCIQHALTELGVAPPPADSLDWCIGPPLSQSFGRLLNSSDGDLLGQAVQLYRQRFAQVGLFENRVYEGIPQTLAALRTRGFRLFLATAKPRVFAQRILDHFDLAEHFDVAYGSELNGHLSDKPSLVQHILVCEALDPEQTMIIGDRHYDILGGKANGIRTGAVTYGFGSEEELRGAGADVFFPTPEGIAEGLLSMNSDASAHGGLSDPV